MSLNGYIRGQPFDIALLDKATNRRAQAKIAPFPITEVGSGGCKASAEVVTASGSIWQLMLSGFESGEDVTITISFKAGIFNKGTQSTNLVASETGEISFAMAFGKVSKGKAAVMAQGSAGCTVMLNFAIGKSALYAE